MENEDDDLFQTPVNHEEIQENADGQEDGEQGGNAAQEDAHEEGHEEEVLARQPTRGERRFQTLTNSNRELKDEVSALRELVSSMRQQTAQPQGPSQYEIAQEQQRLAMMSPEERIEYRLQRMERQNQEASARLERVTLAMQDKTSFDTLCATNKVAADRAGRVEKLVAEHAARGTPVDRMTALKFLIGEDALKNGGLVAAARERGAARIAKASTRPSNGRGDVPAQGRAERSKEQRYKALEDVRI